MNRTAKFFFKFFLIALCSIGIILFINVKYIHGYYYSDVYGEVQKFEDVPYGITFANFGSSHGLAAFRYSEPEEDLTFNFALSGEDIYHDFQTLKQFSDHLNPGCIVTIPVSYFSFCLPTDTPSQKRYYTYLDKQYIREYSYETLINTKYLPVLRSIEFLFKDLIGDQDLDMERFLDDAPMDKSSGTFIPFFFGSSALAEKAANQDNDPNAKELSEHAQTRAKSWLYGRMIMGQKYMDENADLLVQMIEYCREKQFVPVLITTPVYYALRNQFSEDELDYYFLDNVQRVVDLTEIPYFDYSKDDRLIFTSIYYGNSDHMSKEGADAFYTLYREDLRKIGIGG